MSSKSNPRVRKSLDAIDGTVQRKCYFYCLKMLGVLPPPPRSGFKEWKFKTLPYMTIRSKFYTPKCLHDVLIASHATMCEHQNIFFTSYHRNLMVLTEIFLNFAHQVLRKGFPKLEDIYPPSQFENLYNGDKRKAWQNLFDTYAKLQDKPAQIACHYWNPTDYSYPKDKGFKVPKEISKEDDPNDPVNVIFQLINGNNSLPWNINVAHRWFNEESEFDRTSFLNNSNLFQKTKPDVDNFYNSFVKGQQNPREQYKHYLSNPLMKWDRQNSNFVIYRNFLDFSGKNSSNYNLTGIIDDEILSRFGASSKNTQYISDQDCKKNPKLKDIQRQYNQFIPHYSYAESLFNQQGIQDFLKDGYGYQDSHNMMHTLLRVIMTHGLFSITSLIFFPYHSWIDAEYEIYIRRANVSKNPRQRPEKLSTYLNDTELSGKGTARQSDLPKIQDWQISGPRLPKQKAGFYAVFQYISPDRSLISAAFNTRDYFLTKNKIRTSYQMSEIYQKYYIGDLHKERFYFFSNAENFNFDYDYQVHKEGETYEILNENGSNIPNYLSIMKKDIKVSDQSRQQNVKTARQNINAKKQIQKAAVEFQPLILMSTGTANSEKNPSNQMPLEAQANVPSTQLPLQNIPQDQEELNLNKLFANGVHVYASYAPSTENGCNLIIIKPQNLLSDIHEYAKQQKQEINQLIQLEKLDRFIGKGLIVGDIFVFGKEQAAQYCINCKTNKVAYRDVDQEIRLRAPELWKQLHLQSINQQLYDSRNKDVRPKCIYQKIQLVPNPNFLDYRFVRGAEEIEVEVVDRTWTQGSKFIRIQAESYSVEHNTISIIPTKKFYSFSAKLDFYKLFDVHNNGKKEHFDHYVYKVLKGSATLANKQVTKRTDFTLNIPCFQRLLRVEIQVSQENGSLVLLIRDKDFELKKEYYETASKA